MTQREAPVVVLADNARSAGPTAASDRCADDPMALLCAVREITAGGGVEETRARIIGEAARLAGADHVELVLLDPVTGAFGASAPTGDGLPRAGAYAARVVATRCPVYLPDLQHDAPAMTVPVDRARMLGSYLGLPIANRDVLLGVLEFHTAAPRRYSVEHLAGLTAFADHAAVAMHAARRFDAAQAELAERSLAAEALARTNRQLEAALHRANELAVAARAADRAKGDFLATISREIRTPLSGILGVSELLLDTELDADQRNDVETIRHGAESLRATLDNVVDFASIEAGRFDVAIVDCRLRSLIEQVAAAVRPACDAKGLTLDVTFDLDVPSVIRTDAGRLRQVVLNLLNNAIAFTDAGSIRLEIGRSSRGAGEPLLRLAVHDTGVGIEPAALGQLFRPFTHVEASSVRGTGGTGLGLAIAKRLVELLGGTIGVKSRLGHGSTFQVILPLVAATPAAPRPANTMASAPVRNATGADAATVLIVEDNPVNQRVAVRLVERLGFRTEIAGNGEEALACWAPGRFVAILMDCQMPKMDGFVATTEIRQREGPSVRTPIIAITADARPSTRAACYAAGMDDYVSKPFSPADLAAALQRFVGISPAAR